MSEVDFKERAENEYWLNQDGIPMDTEERLKRHAADVQLALLEALWGIVFELAILNKREDRKAE